MLKDKLFSLLESKEDEMITHRRYLHQHPELSFYEEKTSQYILDFYRDKPVEVQANVGGYGIKVTIDSGKPGKTIGLRADFDALPIQEETGLPFASVNPGVMHACGHDAHTAYLMVLADCLIQLKQELVGKVVIIHQPAEEVPPGGAQAMIKDGVLDGIDHVFGIHVSGQVPVGIVSYHSGPTQAARAKFSIHVQGKGGHGAYPHETHDSILAASQLVVSLQSIVSRRLDPRETTVITIGSFDGKGQFNIIKDSVTLEGDVRYFTDETTALVEKEMQALCEGIGAMFHCEVTLDYNNDYPALINDPEMTKLVVDTLTEANLPEITEIVDGGTMTAGEDFAYFSQQRPSAYFYIGAKPEHSDFPHHHPKFDVNEKALLLSAKAVGIVTLRVLGLE